MDLLISTFYLRYRFDFEKGENRGQFSEWRRKQDKHPGYKSSAAEVPRLEMPLPKVTITKH